MKKKNAFLDRVERQKQAAMLETHRFTRQLMVDLSYIALNNAFSLGADRLKKYANALLAVYSAISEWQADYEEAVQRLADRWNRRADNGT